MRSELSLRTSGIPVDREIERIDFDQIAIPSYHRQTRRKGKRTILGNPDVVITQFLLEIRIGKKTVICEVTFFTPCP